MTGVAGPLDLGVESGVFVSSVVNSTGGAVRFNQLVVTFNLVTVTFLSLLLDVVSVAIMDSVLEFVLRMSLKIMIMFKISIYSNQIIN